jgi:hypothetical protein
MPKPSFQAAAEGLPSRRTILVGLAVAPLTALPAEAGRDAVAAEAREAAISPQARIEEAAADLSAAMSALYGRDCWIHIDLDRGVAAVSRIAW